MCVLSGLRITNTKISTKNFILYQPEERLLVSEETYRRAESHVEGPVERPADMPLVF